jgi:hypothetical protein
VEIRLAILAKPSKQQGEAIKQQGEAIKQQGEAIKQQGEAIKQEQQAAAVLPLVVVPQ